MDPQIITENLWKLCIDEIQRRRQNGVSRKEIAQQLGVQPLAITRWLNRERGTKVELGTVLNILTTLEVSVGRITEALGDEYLAIILDFLLKSPEMRKNLAKLITAGGAAQRKVLADIEFAASQLNQQK